MEKVIHKGWEYILYKEDDEYFLSVPCGTIGIFDRNIRLYPDELQKYAQYGEKYIDEFSRAILYTPDDFYGRHLQWLDEHVPVSSLQVTLENNGKPLKTAKVEKGNRENHRWVDMLYNISAKIIEDIENLPKKNPPPLKSIAIEIQLIDKLITGQLPLISKPNTLLDYFAKALEIRLVS